MIDMPPVQYWVLVHHLPGIFRTRTAADIPSGALNLAVPRVTSRRSRLPARGELGSPGKAETTTIADDARRLAPAPRAAGHGMDSLQIGRYADEVNVTAPWPTVADLSRRPGVDDWFTAAQIVQELDPRHHRR